MAFPFWKGLWDQNRSLEPVGAEVCLGSSCGFDSSSDDLVSKVGKRGLDGNSFRAVVFNLGAFKIADAEALRAGGSDLIGQCRGQGHLYFLNAYQELRTVSKTENHQ